MAGDALAGRDPFQRLRAFTQARIGLGRVGQSVPTSPLLDFQLAHARARDAVHAALDTEALARQIEAPTIVVSSVAPDRAAYLKNPGLGRRLDNASRSAIPRQDEHPDLAIVLADGLSATAVHEQAPPLVKALLNELIELTIAPIILARQARVALGDDIGHALGAGTVLMLIGERPGLSAHNSLGAYLTWSPRPGRLDSERNCVSNIRTPGGLATGEACHVVAWLIRAARQAQLTGTGLKDRSSTALLQP